ncbi:MAG: NUDIX hydrolase [Pseudomonadota bacterium]
MIPRYGMPPMRRRYRIRPGVYAILARGSGILVTHQAEPIPEFQLPGGGIDPGEQPLAALHREVFEETGWTIAAPRKIGAFRRFAFMPEYELWAEKICHIYLARPVRARAAPQEPGHTAIWLDPETALEHLATDGDRAFLARALGA